MVNACLNFASEGGHVLTFQPLEWFVGSSASQYSLTMAHNSKFSYIELPVKTKVHGIQAKIACVDGV